MKSWRVTENELGRCQGKGCKEMTKSANQVGKEAVEASKARVLSWHLGILAFFILDIVPMLLSINTHTHPCLFFTWSQGTSILLVYCLSGSELGKPSSSSCVPSPLYKASKLQMWREAADISYAMHILINRSIYTFDWPSAYKEGSKTQHRTKENSLKSPDWEFPLWLFRNESD